MWTVTDDSASGLECSFQPACWFCGADMEAVMLKMLTFDLKKSGEKRNGRAIDVDCLCPQCGFFDVFGVAVDAIHQEDVVRRLNGKDESTAVGEN